MSGTILEGKDSSDASEVPVQSIISDDTFLIDGIGEEAALSTSGNKGVSFFE